jgi:hypothetical protein
MDPFWKQIIALIVLARPVFAIPAILKASSGLLGRIHTLSHGFSGSKLGVNKLAEKTNFNNSHARKQFSEFHQRQKADRKNRIAAGNYRGTNANPLNWGRNATSDLNSRLNKSGAFNTVSMGFGAERDLALQQQNRKDQQDAMALFGNDEDLVKIWALSGGNKNSAEYRGITNVAQKAQFDRMAAAGYAEKSQSFVAAQQYLAENGKGNASHIYAALNHAKDLGASETDIEGAYQTAKASFRGSGRGDVVGEMEAIEEQNQVVNGTKSVSSSAFNEHISTASNLQSKQRTEWSKVTPEKMHREGINDPSFKDWVGADRDNLIKALTAFDRMEGRAQQNAEQILKDAAGMPTASMPDIKKHFNITP